MFFYLRKLIILLLFCSLKVIIYDLKYYDMAPVINNSFLVSLQQCNSGRYKRGICVAARRLDCEQILRDENANPRVQETAK